ncbi:purine-nucleoside phosphorylase [Thermogemmatispora sp.]|uniref:purine-nucleoside phosphorylase n=1 Tax=Thermogemmatispora sp. TaxID=1968838 RepID=UPI0035E4277F
MLYDQVEEAVTAIRQLSPLVPQVGLILGSGLGELAETVEAVATIPYAQLPHWPPSTVAGHAGRLIVGQLEGVALVAMQGRLHFYEGYTPQEVTLPVRVMARLGAQVLLVTNAAGALNPAYQPGDFMLIRDHINLPGLAGWHPLRGPNDERFGVRFPALTAAYDEELRALTRKVAGDIPTLRLHEGVYVMVSGPSYETPAELRFLRQIGGDAVGMSTVSEVIVARHMGLRVLGLSLITNSATGAEGQPVAHDEVLAAAAAASSRLVLLVRGVLRELAQILDGRAEYEEHK